MTIWLALLFALVALVYASIGFGGGSTYNALLALSGIDYLLIPQIALACNIVVVTGGTLRYWRNGLINWRSVLPMLAMSAPASFLGGLLPLREALFLLILGLALLCSAIALLIPERKLPVRNLPKPAILALSGVFGFLAGISGIGGGIFFAPMLYMVRWAEPLRIAAFASLYILVNSLTGFGGQLTKTGLDAGMQAVGAYWPLLLAVLIGGQIGGMIGLRLFSALILRRATALLVGYVAIRLLWQAIWAW